MRPTRGEHGSSRRTFLQQMGWAPLLFLPAPLQGALIGARSREAWAGRIPQFPFSDIHFVPHYPEKSPLDEILRFADPGTDEYMAEGYAAQIMALLVDWSEELKTRPPGISALRRLVGPSIEFNSLKPGRETRIRSTNGIELLRREFPPGDVNGRDRFLDEVTNYLADMKGAETADFEIFECRETGASPLTVSVSIRYEIIGWRADDSCESRVGSWSTRWIREESGAWQASQWSALGEIVTRARRPLFVDITASALDGNESYRNQLLHGADYWRTILDGAIGADVYGNNGVATGDFDNDGFDDLYVCQGAGLPNRLYRNRGDGTLEDVTEKS